MLLYIHIPFCQRRCYYCSFFSNPINISSVEGQQKIQTYFTTLKEELSYWGDKLQRPYIETIFLGGGTPSLLLPSYVYEILEHISQHYKLKSKVEITLEANPESLQTVSLAKEYLFTGVNRISLGFQSTNNKQLFNLGRTHTINEALQSYNTLREALCTNINIDLMWGLPNQTAQQWLNTIKYIIKLQPNHISSYNLTLESKTLFNKQHINKKFILPSEEEQVKMFFQTRTYLEQVGLIQYEISNFAQPGYQCEHNKGYWMGKDYLGVGPSATSTINHYRWTNPANISSWSSLIKKRKEPPKEHIDNHTQVLELLMLRLRTTDGLNIHEYNTIAKDNFIVTYNMLLSKLQQKQLIDLNNNYLRLTPAGQIISNNILKEFFITYQSTIKTLATC